VQLLLRKFSRHQCCICCSETNLTGEHKIKASVLRDEFGNVPLYIGDPNDTQQLKYAQGPKSKAFHFNAKICKNCNSNLSQQGDRAFDEFHKLAKISILENNNEYWNEGIFSPPEFAPGTTKSANIFRYFSKILCCRIAESEGPVFKYLGEHSIGRFATNRIWLQTRKNPRFEQVYSEEGPSSYAAHGGLIVYAKRSNYHPTAFHSSLTIGPVQYIFWFRLHWLESLEMYYFHRKFTQWCIDQAKDGIPENKMLDLGF
jgi:hypothetical protein